MENLERFYSAQKQDYARALAEIQNGYKESHWMWYIFPQIKGLGRSPMAKFYGIKDLDEAVAFLNYPYLGGNLREISAALLDQITDDAEDIFGEIDAMKLKSSMTLFHFAGESREENHVFFRVLCKYFNGKLDQMTLKLLEKS